MTHFHRYWIVGLLTVIGLSISAWAADTVWVGTDPHSPLSVRISPSNRHVEVRLAPGTEKAPRKIEIRFFNEAGAYSTVELSAILPSQTPETRYKGTLTDASRPFVGFELRIPFPRRELVLSSRELTVQRRP